MRRRRAPPSPAATRRPARPRSRRRSRRRRAARGWCPDRLVGRRAQLDVKAAVVGGAVAVLAASGDVGLGGVDGLGHESLPGGDADAVAPSSLSESGCAQRRRMAHSMAGSLKAWGRYWVASIAARIGRPGMTTRRPASRSLDARRRRLLGGHPRRAWHCALKRLPAAHLPAGIPQKSVVTGPGASTVTVTPEPCSSWCSASEKVST